MPTPAPPPPVGRIHVVGAAILDRDRCLVTQRSATMAEPLKWEFPGGKVEAFEVPTEALRREILEELALEIAVGDWLGRGSNDRICLDVFAATRVGGRLLLSEHRACRWVLATEFEGVDWADLDRPILEAVGRRMDFR